MTAPSRRPSETPTEPVTLVLGPVLRAGADRASPSVWVETSHACEVEVNGRRATTFCVGGHHYGLVELEPITSPTTYDVYLDGRQVWPIDGAALDPIEIRAWNRTEPFDIVAGSCRQQAPLASRPWRRRRAGDAEVDRLGPDALVALAEEIVAGRRPAPHLLILMGDQVYADEQHRSVRERLEARRGGPPEKGWPQTSTFEEFTWLYQATWSHPTIRWLLATVPSLMVFDDHDVIDDWNISDTWVRDMAKKPWWAGRLRAALGSYWVYQHLGNLSEQQRRDDPLFQAVTAADDGAAALDAHMDAIGSGDTERLTTSWTFVHDGGPMTLVVLDARNGRVLDPDARSMLSPTDWDRLDATLATASPHVLVVTSVPWILPATIHRLERLVSRLVRESDRAPTRRAAEALRRAIDLEHWAAFGDSHEQLGRRFRDLKARASGHRSSVVLSGDVHFACLAEYEPDGDTVAHQVIASPMRQGERAYETVARRAVMTRPADRLMCWLLDRLTGRAAPTDFEVTTDVWFDNNLASLSYSESEATLQIEAAVLDERGVATLDPLVTRRV